MRPIGSGEELERRRVRALELLKTGLMPVEVARRVGVDRRSVRRWKAAVRAGGSQAVRARPTPGRPTKLIEKDRRRLEAVLVKGAQAAGFQHRLQSAARVTEVIRRRFGVHYHVAHVGRLLHALGFSPQKPARRAIERDEEAIRRWIQVEWPRVKKTPRTAGQRSSSATKRAS